MRRIRVGKSPILVALLATSAVARAEAPPPAAPAVPPPVAAPAPAGEPVAAPGMRIVAGQAPVVGGNAAGARERALDDALRKAVDLAIAELADAPTRTAQARTIKALLARARSYVPRYRTLEEGEVNGVYNVRLEAEVDEAALVSKLDRSAPAPGVTPTARPAPANVAVVAGDKQPPSATVAAGLAAALSAAGVKARVADETAVPAGQVVARVTAETADEGVLRGTGRVSVSCRSAVRLAGSPSQSAAEAAASTRAFAADPEAGHADCLAKLAAELSPKVAAATGSTVAAVATGGDLRTVTVDADVVEPAAVPALVRSVRSVGAVSAAELTRVAGGRAEIRVRARAATPALAAALPRGVGATLALSDVEIAGDVIRLRARLRPAPATPPAGATTP